MRGLTLRDPPFLAAATPSSSWTPASLPSLVAWYDASDAASITASGGLVSQWNDKSGNAHHLTQATGAAQPTTGVETWNALNGIGFTSLAFSMGMTGVTEAPTLRYVAFVWMTKNTARNNQVGWGAGSSDGFDYRLLTNDAGGTRTADVLESGIAHHAGASVFTNSTNNQAYLYECMVDTTAHTIKYFHNSTLDFTNTDTFTFSSAGTSYSMGTGEFVVFETVMCDTTIAGTDQTNLRSYMSTKWAY